MLSAMTTSENFSLSSQSRCSASPYRNVKRSAFGSSLQDECREFLLERGFPGSVFDRTTDDLAGRYPQERKESLAVAAGDAGNAGGVVCNAINVSCGSDATDEDSKVELETDISELLEQLDLEDVAYDQSKPLKIDPNVLKLSFSNLAAGFGSNGERDVSYGSLDEFCARYARENKRASHHLSGGGLLTDASQDIFHGRTDAAVNSRFCALPDGGCISTENIFDFDDITYFDAEYRPSNFLNQISPSSPLTFDLAAHAELSNQVTKGNLTNPESTNPFSGFMKDALDSENPFSSTNPFSSANFHSSRDRPSVEYENVSIPEKSFSRCSTRPASPVSKTSNPEEPCISNPFLLNQASPRSLNVTKIFLNEYPAPQSTLSNPPSSFIFAVPVFPIFQQQQQQHTIANSSTQTSDLPQAGRPPPAPEPVYQNVTNQLRKFMQQNNHSEYDLQCLKATMKDLRNSGWYYENVSWQDSVVLLKNTEPGTFLIRDSSDPNFLFSLSVQTCRGPTSVRLHYVNGQFRLDAEEKLIPHMPSFNSVIELIDYYIENTVKNKFANFKKSAKKSGRDKLQKSKEQVWIDAQGNVYSNILLVKPLYKKDHFSTLQHLTRLAINRHVKRRANSSRTRMSFRVTPVYESSPFQDSSFPASFDAFCPILNVDDLPLPITLINYLKDYPYCH